MGHIVTNNVGLSIGVWWLKFNTGDIILNLENEPLPLWMLWLPIISLARIDLLMKIDSI